MVIGPTAKQEAALRGKLAALRHSRDRTLKALQRSRVATLRHRHRPKSVANHHNGRNRTAVMAKAAAVSPLGPQHCNATLTLARHKSQRPEAPTSEATIAILVYGLVRSERMLECTSASLYVHIIRPLILDAVTFVHAWCVPPACDVGNASALLRRWPISEGRLHMKFGSSQPKQLGAAGPASRCVGNLTKESRGNVANAASALLSLIQAHLAFSASDAARNVKSTMIARIDVLFIGPTHLRFHKTKPWLHPRTIYLPGWQSHSGLNDRFSFGARGAMKVFLMQRLDLMMGTDQCWDWGPEFACCIAAKRANLSVRFTDVRFVRLRGNLDVPRLDRSVILNSTADQRNWHAKHAVVCSGEWMNKVTRLLPVDPRWSGRVVG